MALIRRGRRLSGLSLSAMATVVLQMVGYWAMVSLCDTKFSCRVALGLRDRPCGV